jgi:hypothetical protein
LVGGVSGAVMGAGGGAGGEFARQKTAGTKAELPVSILGAVGGAAAGGGAMAAARRVVTPRNIPPENAAAARVLRREGIGDLTEGQVTQSKKLQAAGWAFVAMRVASTKRRDLLRRCCGE